MRKMVMYQENLDECVGNGAIEQEVAIIKENADGAKITLYCVIRNADGKVITKCEKVERETDTFESGVQICKLAKFEEVEEYDRLVNFNDEWAIIFELKNGKSFYLFDNGFNFYHISKLFDNADKATDIIYRQGFRF